MPAPQAPPHTTCMSQPQFGHSDDENLDNTKKEPPRCNCVKILKSNALVVAMMCGVFAGFAIGVGLGSMDTKLTKVQIAYLQFPGDLFIQLMMMLIIPIVVSSLLCSVAEIDIRSSGKIGLLALVYYISTMVLASLMGMAMSLTIRPGWRTNSAIIANGTESLNSGFGLAMVDLLRNMVPDNLVEACFLSKKTSMHTADGSRLPHSTKNDTFNETSQPGEYLLQTKQINGMNTLGLLAASIAFGLGTSAAGTEARPFLDFFIALRCVTFRLVSIFIWVSPVGICFLIASKMAEMDNPTRILADLALYVVCALTGLICHGLIVLSLLYLIIVRKNPLRFLSGMFPALIFAFGSSSSAATLPLTIKCLEERNGVDPRVTKLIASVGATINMDGSVINLTIISIFVAQLNGISLDAGQLVTLCVLSVSIAAGSAGVPNASYSYLIVLLSALGLPLHDIGSLFAVGWFTDRVLTATNVLGDAYGAGIIEHLLRKRLRDGKHLQTVICYDLVPGDETEKTSTSTATVTECTKELME